jgi:hypothetical protein
MGWTIEYYDEGEEELVEISGRMGEIVEELNGHEEATFYLPNTAANRAIVASTQIVKISYDEAQMFFGALFGVEYSSKELKCIVYNGVYEIMKRRVISETYEATPADDIMDDIATAASLINPVGSCPSTALDMEFDQTLCLDAMLEVAKACNCDYWTVDGATLYLGTRGSVKGFDASKAKVMNRGIDRSKNRDKVHVRGFNSDGDQLMGVAGTGDNVAVFWNNYATTEETLDYLAAKLLEDMNQDDSSIKLICPISEADYLFPGDTISVTKAELNLSGSYRISRIVKSRSKCEIDLNRMMRTTENILEELAKTRNEMFSFTKIQAAGESLPYGVGFGNPIIANLGFALTLSENLQGDVHSANSIGLSADFEIT